MARRVAFQARVEETRRVIQRCAFGEGQLHDLFVGLPGADDAGVLPNRYPSSHFHSSTTSGSACLMIVRARASVLPRQSPSCSILSSMSCDGEVGAFPVFALLLVVATVLVAFVRVQCRVFTGAPLMSANTSSQWRVPSAPSQPRVLRSGAVLSSSRQRHPRGGNDDVIPRALAIHTATAGPVGSNTVSTSHLIEAGLALRIARELPAGQHVLVRGSRPRARPHGSRARRQVRCRRCRRSATTRPRCRRSDRIRTDRARRSRRALRSRRFIASREDVAEHVLREPVDESVRRVHVRRDPRRQWVLGQRHVVGTEEASEIREREHFTAAPR